MTDNTQPNWFIDEGIPGVGDRPSWLPDKFKTVAEMARANSELEKRLGSVPDSYDTSKAKFIDPDYAPFQDFLQVAKDKRVPQDVLDKFFESTNKYMDEFSTNVDEEIKKLGDNAKERVTTLDNWLKANYSKEAYEALTSNMRTADTIKALEELRGKHMSSVVQVPGNNGNVSSTATVADLQIELQTNIQKYKDDKAYRDDLSRRMEVAVKNDPNYVDKVGG